MKNQYNILGLVLICLSLSVVYSYADSVYGTIWKQEGTTVYPADDVVKIDFNNLSTINMVGADCVTDCTFDTISTSVLTATRVDATIFNALTVYQINDTDVMSNSGSNNIFIGDDSGHDAGPLAVRNTGVGYQSLYGLVAGQDNVGVGNTALYNIDSGNGNTAVGGEALYSLVNGAYNTVVGYFAGYTDTIGSNNTISGTFAAYNAFGNDNTISGYSAAPSAGTSNVFVGSEAALSNSGDNNVFVGYQSGYNSVGSGNVLLGYQSGYSETGNNKLYISNSDTVSPLIYGEFDNNFIVINNKLRSNGYYTAFRNLSSATETLTSTDYFINCLANDNEVVATMPPIDAAYSQTLMIKYTDPGSTNKCKLDGNGVEQVEGFDVYSGLDTYKEGIILKSDGAAWWITGGV